MDLNLEELMLYFDLKIDIHVDVVFYLLIFCYSSKCNSLEIDDTQDKSIADLILL